MRIRCMFILLIAAVLLVGGSPSAQAAGRVQLELVGKDRGASMAFQEWARTLAKAGIRNVRIRTGGAADRVGIEVRGTEASPLYVVTGIVKSRNELLLPSGRFRQSDVGRLKRWLDDLARLGPEERREARVAFGLLASQYKKVQADTARSLGFATAGVARRTVVERIGERLTLPLKFEPGTAKLLASDKVAEELDGLSCGTALAYVLRPMGLCMVPREVGGQPQYAIVRAKPKLEIWPVGWKPDGPARKVLPALYEFHNINIENVPVARVLEAVDKSVKVPVLLDHNALARHGVDPAKALVSHPRSRTSYSLALRRVLFQAGLKFEVRVDEAGRPFLWVSTTRPM